MSVQCHACIGGTNVGEDIRKLDYGQHIVAGTPGRVFGKYAYCGLSCFLIVQQMYQYHVICLFCVDMIRRRNLRTRAIKLLVLDESDEMLNKGFKEQIYDVYRYLPPAIQVCPLTPMVTLCENIICLLYRFASLVLHCRMKSWK